MRQTKYRIVGNDTIGYRVEQKFLFAWITVSRGPFNQTLFATEQQARDTVAYWRELENKPIKVIEL